MGGIATQPLRSRGPVEKGTRLAHGGPVEKYPQRSLRAVFDKQKQSSSLRTALVQSPPSLYATMHSLIGVNNHQCSFVALSPWFHVYTLVALVINPQCCPGPLQGLVA